MSLRSVALLLLALGPASCFSALKVGDGDEGLPFYPRVGVDRQTTEYRVSSRVATMTLSVFEKAADGKAGASVSKQSLSKTLDEDNAAAFAAVRASLANPKPVLPNVFSAFAALSEGRQGDPVMVENSIQRVAVVDYTRPRSLHVRTPVFGSSTFKPELNPDGTLSKLEASVTSSPEKIADLVPLKDVILGGSGLAEAAAFTWSPDSSSSRVHELTLTVDEVGYREVWTYDWPWKVGPIKKRWPQLPPLDKAGVLASYRRLPLSAPKPPDAEQDAYSFSGSVKVPKGKP